MSIEAILMPMFAQVALTFVLLFWMSLLRLRACAPARCRRTRSRCASPLAAARDPDRQRLP